MFYFLIQVFSSEDANERVKRALDSMQNDKVFGAMSDTEKIQYIEQLLEETYLAKKDEGLSQKMEDLYEPQPLPNEKKGLPLSNLDKVEIRKQLRKS